MKRSALVVCLLMVAATSHLGAQQPRASNDATAVSGLAGPIALLPTNHPRVSRDISQLWLAPAALTSTGRASLSTGLVAAIKLHEAGSYAKALPLFSHLSSDQGPVGEYASYYAAMSELRLGRAGEARRAFRAFQTRPLVGYLVQASALGEAEADEALNDPRAAVEVYERLLRSKVGAADEVWMRLGGAAKAVGDTRKASEAFARVYYEFPLSEHAPAAWTELARLSYLRPLTPGTERYKLELERAERLFGARQYGPARSAFDAIRISALGDDGELVNLRLAEADYYLKRARLARDGVRPYLNGRRQAEALFFYAVSSNDLGDKAEYLKGVRRLVDQFPDERWGEEALNHLATEQSRQNDDAAADATLRELCDKYPSGAHADRAAWKVGWRAYREGRFEDTVRYFERAAAAFPRSDYRPAWLYWSGRAYEQLKTPALAEERFGLTTADYLNSYYGRLAVARLGGRVPAPRVIATSAALNTPPASLLPNGAIIRMLLERELYDDALNELRFAERMWGGTPAIGATIAWVHQKQGEHETGSKRFTLIRGSIIEMRRTYPQFLAAGGEELPREILTVIYPLAYWDLVRKYSAERKLDPYLVAALVGQESTFVPDIKSYANAVGLMQLMPFTARQWAQKVGIRYTPTTSINPEANIRIGTAYFADKMREFGDVHLALASYNAGERPVHAWIAQRPGIPSDEFVDDIPYAQTQNYVKRILGTAEDYRRLYGGSTRAEELTPAVKLAPVAQGVGAAPARQARAPKTSPATKKSAAKPLAKKMKPTSTTNGNRLE